MSFEKLRARTGFRARHRLRDAILELKQAFDEGLIEDYTAPRYHNQRFLELTGSPAHKDDFDTLVMAAFTGRATPREAAAD